MRNQLQEHLQLQALIYAYLDRQFPIDGGNVYVGLTFKEFNTPWIIPASNKRVTTIDNDICDIFGVTRDSFFFNWTEVRIGPIVTVILGNNDITFYGGTLDITFYGGTLDEVDNMKELIKKLEEYNGRFI